MVPNLIQNYGNDHKDTQAEKITNFKKNAFDASGRSHDFNQTIA